MEAVMVKIVAAVLFSFVSLLAWPPAAVWGEEAHGTTIVCRDLVGLNEKLKKITSETQVTHPYWSTDIWNGKGCTLVDGRSHTANPQTAYEKGVPGWFYVGNGGWIVTSDWLVPVEKFSFTDKAKGLWWRPVGIIPRSYFDKYENCFGYQDYYPGAFLLHTDCPIFNYWLPYS